jgi:hypothetical protein
MPQLGLLFTHRCDAAEAEESDGKKLNSRQQPFVTYVTKGCHAAHVLGFDLY